MCELMYNAVGKLTATFHALVYESVEQRATVVAEGGTGVRLDLKHVLSLQVLRDNRKKPALKPLTQSHTHSHTHIHTHYPT